MAADPISAVVAEWKGNERKQAGGGILCVAGKKNEIIGSRFQVL